MYATLICVTLALGQAPDTAPPAGKDAAAPTGKQAAAKAKTDEAAPEAGEDAADETPDTEPSTPEPSWFAELTDSGAMGYMKRGGFFMWPILIMGIIALGVMIERFRSLRMLATDTAKLRDEVLDLMYQHRVEEALELCDREQGPVPAILGTGLRKLVMLQRLGYDPGRIEEQVVKSMDDYGIHIVAALERHLPILASVSTAAPMLGFLGTVQGMIVAFDDIVAKMGEMNIVEAAAGGISVALLTTCFGLIVGLPSLLTFNYFTSVINRFVLDVEQSATELIEAVTMQMAIEEQAGVSSGGSKPAEEGAEVY